MQRLFKNRLIVITAVILFATIGAARGTAADGGESRPHQSVYSISEKWLSVKKDFNAPADGLVVRINDFCLALNSFFSSPIGSLYQIHRPETIEYLEQVNSAAERLKTAIIINDITATYSTAIEIDASLDGLQRIENDLSDASQRNSFSLFLFFSLLVIAVVLFILLSLYTRLGRAKKREQQSIAFSRETIIAQEQERSRIARELHDTVAQDLLQLSLRTEIMNKEADPSKRNSLCNEVVNGQRTIMKRIRDICENLIPPEFQRRRLGDVLHILCQNFQQRTNIECHIKIQKDLPLAGLDADTQLQCFRIVQECLSNIEKHSGAAECSVLVYREKEGGIIISVSDEGKGLSPTLQHNDNSFQNLKEKGCLGLRGMYERAAAINGGLTLESEPGEGTTVTLKLIGNR
jgi:signal transduction histidine kinase